MSESTTIRYVGLDVHRDSIAIAVASSGWQAGGVAGDGPQRHPGLDQAAAAAGARGVAAVLLRGRADRLRPGAAG